MELKVSSKSNPNSVAGAIAGAIRNNEKVEMHSIGAGALNQSVKAVIIARGFLAPLGKNIVIEPAFNEVEIDGEQHTGIKLILKEM